MRDFDQDLRVLLQVILNDYFEKPSDSIKHYDYQPQPTTDSVVFL